MFVNNAVSLVLFELGFVRQSVTQTHITDSEGINVCVK